MSLLISVITQSITFLPLALGISISYTILRATDMTLDGSFVLGGGVFAHLVALGTSPEIAAMCALLSGAAAGIMVSFIQRGGRVDPLLAGVLATFILTSGNLIIMGRPNINLLSAPLLINNALEAFYYCAILCLITCVLIRSQFGLTLRALGDNPILLKRLGKNIEGYRTAGFALTNTLSAASGCLTAQMVGYADIGMGVGMTLTGIGAIILGQQILRLITKKSYLRIVTEFIACLFGVLLYFFAINSLLRLSIDPLYLKLVLGMILIFFLRTAVSARSLA